MWFRPARIFGRAARPEWQRLCLAAALGVLVASGQAPLSYWWLSLVALWGLTALIAAEARRPQTIWLGWTAGVGFFVAAMFWIVEPFLVDVPRHGWMAPFALILMAGGMALFWALAAAFATTVRSSGGRAIAFAIGLASTDLLRTYAFTGFPWALVGHIWIDTPVLQAAAVAGPIGLSLLTTVLAALPALPCRPALRWAMAGAASLCLGGVWWAGAARLDRTEPIGQPPRHVRLIQPNAAQDLKWRADMWPVFLDRQLVQTALPSDQPLDLIVWPEVAVPFLLDRSGSLSDDIIAASNGVPVALGIQRSDGPRYFNSLVVIDGAGEVAAVYDKFHLVPFGEYIPFGDIMANFGLRAFAAREGYGYTAGPGAAVLDLGRVGKVLPLICYESVFPQDLHAAPERAEWIMQVTNDGWFGTVSGPYQHLAQARLRAVEQGLPLLRAANTGVSAVIDAKGRVLQSLPLNSEGVIDTAVPAALPATVYARTGDWPLAVLLLFASGFVLVFGRRQSD